eukprot:TRINITY_DN94467_c0_g1_i1.p3 TRINITY_DN94467_c0_g1~~TRINITY_DN94467_c0_g1_i1.p3  ORF type:complete len:161 (-),score=14.33 TRINITY_DN94467_c0_g1_i1:76-558(-)
MLKYLVTLLKALKYATWCVFCLDAIESGVYFVICTTNGSVNLGIYYIVTNKIYYYFLLEAPVVLLTISIVLFSIIWKKYLGLWLCKSSGLLVVTMVTFVVEEGAFIVTLWMWKLVHYWVNYKSYFTVVLLQIPFNYFLYAIFRQIKRKQLLPSGTLLGNQ